MRFKSTFNAKAYFVEIVPCCFSYKLETLKYNTVCLKDILATADF